MITDINSEDRLVQRTFATILRIHLGALLGITLALRNRNADFSDVPVTVWLLLKAMPMILTLV